MSEVACESRDPGLQGVVPFRFACHRCGNCCSGGQGYVWLEAGETASLAHFLGLSEEKFIERFVRRVVDPRTGAIELALREASNGGDAGGRCVLLEGANTCSAYSARPAHCRAFPYWPSVLADERAFEVARGTCPGIAVETPHATRARAFARLEQLYSDVEAYLAARDDVPHGVCCLVRPERTDLFATALEADHAAEHAVRASTDGSESSCLLGRARPLGCRLANAGEHEAREQFFERLRTIERELGYPSAYGRMAELLRARGVPAGTPKTQGTQA